MRNTAADWWRKPRLALTALPAEVAAHEERASAPTDERSKTIRAAWWELSTEDREILILRHMRGFDEVTKIAVFLRLPAATVRQRYKRAKDRFERRLQSKGIVFQKKEPTDDKHAA
jgi:DNA-directed RNA polymerase specialized sigma24 family protein